jgi:hypothetical protein
MPPRAATGLTHVQSPRPLVPARSHSGRHSITPSATARMLGGMVRPSALAIFMFMTNSNLFEN